MIYSSQPGFHKLNCSIESNCLAIEPLLLVINNIACSNWSVFFGIVRAMTKLKFSIAAPRIEVNEICSNCGKRLKHNNTVWLIVYNKKRNERRMKLLHNHTGIATFIILLTQSQTTPFPGSSFLLLIGIQFQV